MRPKKEVNIFAIIWNKNTCFGFFWNHPNVQLKNVFVKLNSNSSLYLIFLNMENVENNTNTQKSRLKTKSELLFIILHLNFIIDVFNDIFQL